MVLQVFFSWMQDGYIMCQTLVLKFFPASKAPNTKFFPAKHPIPNFSQPSTQYQIFPSQAPNTKFLPAKHPIPNFPRQFVMHPINPSQAPNTKFFPAKHPIFLYTQYQIFPRFMRHVVMHHFYQPSTQYQIFPGKPK